jgi:hypothetical protein
MEQHRMSELMFQQTMMTKLIILLSIIAGAGQKTYWLYDEATFLNSQTLFRLPA